jgi:hypothetical protein
MTEIVGIKENLRTADLAVDRVYKGRNSGNFSDIQSVS